MERLSSAERGLLYRARHPELVRTRTRAYQLSRHYGWTVEQYDALLAEQGGVCAICGRPETATHGGQLIRLAVDHDKETGRVRGLLCGDCNRAIGLLGHDLERLRQAIEYLREGRLA